MKQSYTKNGVIIKMAPRTSQVMLRQLHRLMAKTEKEQHCSHLLDFVRVLESYQRWREAKNKKPEKAWMA